MKFKYVILAALGALITGIALIGQTPEPISSKPSQHKRELRMERRADRQQKRISEGVKAGQLTPREAARLERGEAKIQRDIAAAKADGKVTAKEAKKINGEQNRASREIRREKHDLQNQK